MKYLILLLTLLTFNLRAQDPYTEGMSKAFELWQSGKSTEAIALFERISQAEAENWLPPYYAANVLIAQSFTEGTPEQKMAMLEKAKTHIKTAHDRSPENSEIVTMEGLLYTGYVAMDPATYGMKYSIKIMGLHQKAMVLDPENPRAKANSIEYEMGGAQFFGQDLTPFCAQMKTVLPLFDAQKTDVPFAPSYGKERAQEFIDNCK